MERSSFQWLSTAAPEQRVIREALRREEAVYTAAMRADTKRLAPWLGVEASDTRLRNKALDYGAKDILSEHGTMIDCSLGSAVQNHSCQANRLDAAVSQSSGTGEMRTRIPLQKAPQSQHRAARRSRHARNIRPGHAFGQAPVSGLSSWCRMWRESARDGDKCRPRCHGALTPGNWKATRWCPHN